MADWDEDGGGASWEDMDAPPEVGDVGGAGGAGEEDEDLGPEEVTLGGDGADASGGAGGFAVKLGAGVEDDSGPARKKKLQKQRAREARERREKEAAEIKKRLAEDAPLDDPVAEKARQRRLVEEADHELTDELFSAGAPSGAGEEAKEEASLEKVLASLTLATEADYTALAKAVAERAVTGGATAGKKAILNLAFLQELIRGVAPALTADDFTKLNKTTNAIKNEKITAAKGKGKKKSKYAGKQGYANVQSTEDWMGGDGRAEIGGDMDDFM